MFDSIRPELEKAKQFAKNHHTTVACAATAIVSWKMSKSVTTRSFANEIEELTELVYGWGRENGVLMLQNRVMLDFINLNDMGENLKDHILSMKG